MNQFRDLTMAFLIILAVAVGYSSPDDWTCFQFSGDIGSSISYGLHLLAVSRPWCVVIMLALALALFMTRLKY